MEPTADAVRPRGSVGTSELDEKPGNATNKPEAVKSGDAKSHPKQSSPTPNVTIGRPRRHVDQLNGGHHPRLCRSAPCHGNADIRIDFFVYQSALLNPAVSNGAGANRCQADGTVPVTISVNGWVAFQHGPLKQKAPAKGDRG